MRIQHNISAMNSYRQLGNNNNMLSKNLEKLSSGYRINRAGDDAAGLAISEKMRAQIKGLETAQKNANDGISLVQTAEGALTEVHSMLNRMTELATQSANGTYDNDVDRNNLQKEIESLKSEIDRISESTNFNGINLLDGSLGAATTSSTAGKAASGDYGKAVSIMQNMASPDIVIKDGSETTKASFEVDFEGLQLKGGDADATATVTIGGKAMDIAVAKDVIMTDKDIAAKATDLVIDGVKYKASTAAGSTKVTYTAEKYGAMSADTKSALNDTVSVQGNKGLTDPKKAGTKAQFELDFSSIESVKYNVDDYQFTLVDSNGTERGVLNATGAVKSEDAAGFADAFDGAEVVIDGMKYTAASDGAGKLTFTAAEEKALATSLKDLQVKSIVSAGGEQDEDGVQGAVNDIIGTVEVTESGRAAGQNTFAAAEFDFSDWADQTMAQLGYTADDELIFTVNFGTGSDTTNTITVQYDHDTQKDTKLKDLLNGAKPGANKVSSQSTPAVDYGTITWVDTKDTLQFSTGNTDAVATADQIKSITIKHGKAANNNDFASDGAGKTHDAKWIEPEDDKGQGAEFIIKLSEDLTNIWDQTNGTDLTITIEDNGETWTFTGVSTVRGTDKEALGTAFGGSQFQIENADGQQKDFTVRADADGTLRITADDAAAWDLSKLPTANAKVTITNGNTTNGAQRTPNAGYKDLDIQASFTNGTNPTVPADSAGQVASAEVDFAGKNGSDIIGTSMEVKVGNTTKTFTFVSKDEPNVTDENAIKIDPSLSADRVVKSIAEQLKDKVEGFNVGTEGTKLKFTEKGANGATAPEVAIKGAGLKLQIGDTSDEYNKVTVAVADMSAKSLGIADIDISTQTGASDAIGKIKDAINKVSSTRGDLGAIQNRLEHTINNLGVTTENMTAAESRIRDTDMASEMMAYTKNNILIQASQAMLAQANQVPQGVLQLLQ